MALRGTSPTNGLPLPVSSQLTNQAHKFFWVHFLAGLFGQVVPIWLLARAYNRSAALGAREIIHDGAVCLCLTQKSYNEAHSSAA
jgi:hypothetical protein